MAPWRRNSCGRSSDCFRTRCCSSSGLTTVNPDPLSDGMAAPHQFLDVAEVYDSLMAGVPYPYWVTYVEEVWDRFDFEPRTVLDLACGTGNVTVELMKRGYRVTGVDYSETMLREARKKLPE